MVRWLSVLLLGILLTGVLGLTGCSQERRSTQRDGPSTASSPDPSTSVNLEVVKYDQLLDAVRSQRGRIVVMDVWASWCVPCRKEFHHVVELHHRHAKDGVVCVSVTLDEPKQRDTALSFLQSKGATFPNYLLDEGEAGWDKFNLKGIPAVFVYDRDGQLARKFTGDDPDNQFTYADVEKLVNELLGRGRSETEKPRRTQSRDSASRLYVPQGQTGGVGAWPLTVCTVDSHAERK